VKQLAISAWLVAALIVGCASSQYSAKPSKIQREQQVPQVMRSDPHDEITQLDQQIEQERVTMGLGDRVTPMATCPDCPVAPVEPFAVRPSSTELTCRPASNDGCRDICTISDSICINADKICSIAQQLAGDKWAADKCSTSKTTCEAAHAKCCGCQ
jgi:hypothetical protein